MYIKEIIIDGFKSYGQRTEIKGFDDQFNAITGLNGSGKSNILDSICFVLGISNLTQVRANSLQDLIYKQGQTGVTTATVSLVFDNSNPNQSPPGFNNFDKITVTRQIAKGGKSKYLVNGLVVQNKKVIDLFGSVQLNVNNPHFLIMQGRITKVLNMKPVEILLMIEEAAGTRMYEAKRLLAQKTIEKKEAKLEELNAMIRDEISPKLEKLRADRSSFLEFQRLERELEYMLALYQAYQFYATQRKSSKVAENLKNAQQKIKSIEEGIEERNQKIETLNGEIDEAHKNQAADDKLSKLEASLKEKEKEEIKANSSIKGAKSRADNEEKKIKQLVNSLKDDEQSVTAKTEELKNLEDKFASLKEDNDKDLKALEIAQKKYEAVCAGMEVNDDGVAETLQDQLMKAREAAMAANTEIKQAEMNLTFSQRELKEKSKNITGNAGDYEKNKAALVKVQREVTELQQSLAQMNYSEEQMQELINERHSITKQCRQLSDRIDSFESKRPLTKFYYKDPEHNFNHNSVHGVVCKLFKMKDSSFSTALETVAGGKLYNVIIDTSDTGKKLLKHGQLQQRVTFIPLNLIQCSKIDNRLAKLAEDTVGKGNVYRALDLIEYDPRDAKAMMFVFGNTFVCKDLHVAKEIAFHQSIRKRCITFDGDVVDPSGTLSGGAANKGGQLLSQLEEIISFEKRIKEHERSLQKLGADIRRMEVEQNNYMPKKQLLDQRKCNMAVLEKQLQQTAHGQMQEEINNLKCDIESLNAKIQESKEKEAKNKKLATDIESRMKNVKGHREKQLKEAEADMKKLKLKSEASKKKWTQNEETLRTLNFEIEEVKKSIATSTEQLETAKKHLSDINNEMDDLKEGTGDLKDEVERLRCLVKAEKDIISQNNAAIQAIEHTKKKMLKEIAELELDIKRQEHEVKKYKEEHELCKAKEKEATRRVTDNNKYKDEAQQLTEKAAGELEKKIRESQEKKTKLGRTVNSKAQALYEQEEKQLTYIIKRKAIVENDRKKILDVIIDLDKKTKDIIDQALKQITKDFGSIFSTLLPGSNSKLVPINPSKISLGIEVKVFLGGVWKENLSELSGGQRSLVALSLVLAMLLFKPAPLYILDEIDAALDLSHTQNIGEMLKAHFKQSQFIIVSLKDGMFNNANVLFKTKFVDGMSTVTRTVNRNA